MRFVLRILTALCLLVVLAAAAIMYWNASAKVAKPGAFSFTWLPAAKDDAAGAAFDRHFAPNSQQAAAIKARDSASAATSPSRDIPKQKRVPSGGKSGSISDALRKSPSQ